MKGYLNEIFNTDFVAPKDSSTTTDSVLHGIKINAGGKALHGGNKEVRIDWMIGLLKILQYAYHRPGSDWLAFNIKINVLPKSLQYLDQDLSLRGRELWRLIMKQVSKDTTRFDGNYRIHLEQDEANDGGYHYHIALVATGIKSETAIELAFRKVQSKHPEFSNACLEFIRPDINRVRNEDDRYYFEKLLVKPNASLNFMQLDSDAAFEYMAFVFSYHAKLYTKEGLLRDGVAVASGNHLKDFRKGLPRKNAGRDLVWWENGVERPALGYLGISRNQPVCQVNRP